MQTVRMHVDGSGVLWAMTQCRVCGEIHKFLAADVVSGPVACKSCGRQMSIDGATVEAAFESHGKLDGDCRAITLPDSASNCRDASD